jgi:hypothetical protein
VFLPQGAGSGCGHRISFVSPAGLAVGLALKELRYADHRDSPPGREAINWFPHAHQLAGLGSMDAGTLAADRIRRTEKRRILRAFHGAGRGWGGYCPATFVT